MAHDPPEEIGDALLVLDHTAAGMLNVVPVEAVDGAMFIVVVVTALGALATDHVVVGAAAAAVHPAKVGAAACIGAVSNRFS